MRSERGVGLVETLVAVAVLGLALTVLVVGVSTGSLGVATTEERVTAENLARSQLEYTKSLEYVTAPGAYPIVTPAAADYSLSVQTESIPGAGSDIEKVTVTVARGGETLMVVEGFKVDR
jgi:type II secretory pathway pseudopilin PulG